MIHETIEYSKIKDKINFMTQSHVRIVILTALFDKKLSIKEIHEATNLNYSSITANLSKLEQKNYISKDKNKYYLKSLVKIKLVNTLVLNKSIHFIKEYSEFFNRHLIQDKQLNALKELPVTTNNEIIQSDIVEPYKTTEKFKEIFMSVGEVRAICIYLHPNCDEIIPFILSNKTRFTGILNQDVAKNLLENFKKYDIPEDIKNEEFNIKLTPDDLKLALIVSEDAIIMGLYKKYEDEYDKNSCFYSEDPIAIEWGKQLFEEYEERADESISINDIL